MGPVIDRVSVVAQRAVNSPLIFETAVERDFVPPPNTVAFDLGPPDSTVAVGFERVDPESGVLSGKDLTAQSRFGGGALLSDGVSGVEGFTAQVPNGSYRVVLLADTPPEGRVPSAPFGTVIDSGNDSFYLGKARPAQWLSRAWIANPVLSEPALREIYRSLPGHQILADDPMRGSGGYGYGIAFKTEVTGGFIDVRIETPEDSEPIYVSAIVVQPADQKAVWLTERNIVTNALAHRFLQVMDARGNVSPRRAAAIVAYAVHQRPDRATEIFRAGMALFPDATGQIARAVAGLDAVKREQVVAWVSEESGLTQAQKREALGDLGRTQEVRRSTQ